MFRFFKKPEERAYSATTVGSFFDDAHVGNPLSIPAVYAAVNLISNAVASATLINSPVKEEPMENVTRFDWLKVISRNMLIHGNAYAWILNHGIFKLLDPKDVVIYYDKDYNHITHYGYHEKKILPEDMLHFKDLTTDGLGQVGLSRIVLFNNTFKRVQVMSEYEGNYMTNSARPSLWVKVLKNLKQESLDELKTAFKDAFSGTKNSGKVPVLTDGMELNELKAVNSLVDADLVALKQASLKEIAQIFNMPVSMLDNSLATYSNAVEAHVQFLKMTVAPLLNNIKEEINLKMTSYMSVDTSSYLEGSFEQKINTLSTAISSGILTSNEARERLGYVALGDGNVLFAPAGTPTKGGNDGE